MKQSPNNYFIIVPAAGIGTRMKSMVPKQYLKVRGKCIIEYTLQILLDYTLFKKCVVVINKHDKYWPSIKPIHPKLLTIIGGKERVNSVFNGLIALQNFANANDWVLVHDSVRPFLHPSDIDKLITTVGDDPVGGILGSPLKNTIKKIQNSRCTHTLNRKKIWQALTPQMFRYQWLFKALNFAIKKQHHVTDESNAIELLEKYPKIVEGRSDNIKITDNFDLTLFEYYQTLL